jgi:hypothetical protein
MKIGLIICVPNLHTLKSYDWSEEKDIWLKRNRGIGFKEILFYLSEPGHLLDDAANPNHPTQRIYVLDINSYIYLVPYVEDAKKIFLKTIYPSRKMTKHYLKH